MDSPLSPLGLPLSQRRSATQRRRTERNIFGAIQRKTPRKMDTRAIAISGGLSEIHMPMGISASSARLKAIFEKGSGLWFTASRVDAFEPVLASATPPQRIIRVALTAGSKLPSAAEASRTAPTGRMKV